MLTARSSLPLLVITALLRSTSAQQLVDPVNQVGNFYSFSIALHNGAFQVFHGLPFRQPVFFGP